MADEIEIKLPKLGESIVSATVVQWFKKVGDRVGTTLDGGDAPILLFSFGGVALTIAFGIWAVNNL